MRKDGIRVKNIDSTHKIMPYLMKGRVEAEVYQTIKIDITELMKYLNKIESETDIKVTLFHAIIAALSKTIYNRPLLNRFVSGRRYYDRNNISFSFVAKNKFEDDAEERLIILKIKYGMKLIDISKKIIDKVSKTRNSNTNSMNDTLRLVTSFPRFIITFIMNIFRLMDYFGIVPKSISDTDPNYSTILISNLGSIKCDCCYHHLNNYGTNSIVSTIGIIEEDEKNHKKYVNISFTLDERIADGFYFAKSIKLFKHILENPKYLEDELLKKIDFDEIK